MVLPMKNLWISDVDIIGYVEENGIELTPNPIDGPNAGRVIGGNATLIRDGIAVKYTLKIKFRPLTGDELTTITGLFWPGLLNSIAARFRDPHTRNVTTFDMYVPAFPMPLETVDPTTGLERWAGVAITAIEL